MILVSMALKTKNKNPKEATCQQAQVLALSISISTSSVTSRGARRDRAGVSGRPPGSWTVTGRRRSHTKLLSEDHEGRGF